MRITAFVYFILSLTTLSVAQDSSQIVISEAELSDSRTFTIPLAELANVMSQAPDRDSRSSTKPEISLPLPSGKMVTYEISAASIMHPTMQEKYPDIRSFVVRSTDGKVSGRLALSPLGLSGLVFSPEGDIYYEPISGDTHKTYRADYRKSSASCETNHERSDRSEHHHTSRTETGGQRRIFTMAVAGSGEWSNKYGNNLVTINSKINEYLTELNAIYERDLAITIELTQNNDDIIFFNPLTDGLDSNAPLTTAQLIISANIPASQYDIGHVFYEMTAPAGGWTGSGVAGLGVVCDNTTKAGGWSGCGGPYPTSFWMGIFAHEVGHQFAASHSFYGTTGNCGASGQRDPASAVEPGSGNTLMSYEGSCGAQQSCDSQNITPGSSFLYFHSFSIEQIHDFIDNSASCFDIVNINNSAPTVNLPSDVTIPKSTPFILSATANDADGDPLLLGWEEVDTDNLNLSCPQGHPDDASTSTTAPLFRSFSPSAGGDTRSFPQMSDLVNNTQTLGEILPAVGRTIDMRFTARAEAFGGVTYEDMTVTVAGNSGPFEVLTANAPIGYQSNQSVTIQWSVNNTNTAPVSCSNVNILFSFDGGQTFPLTLANNTPNDGSQSINMPSNGTETGRIKIEAVGNIFFDINDADIAILSTCNPITSTISNDEDVIADAGDPSLDLDLVIGDYVTNFSGTLENGDPIMNIVIENINTNSCQFFSNLPKYQTVTLMVETTDTYTFSSSASYFEVVNLYETSFDDGNVCNNWLASSGQFDPSNNQVSFIDITYTLTAGTQIVLLLSEFSGGSTGPFDVNITSAGGGQLIQSTNFPTGYNYKFVISDSNDIVKAIEDDADLSDDSLYQGGIYKARGILVFGNGTLSTYVGQPLSVLANAIATGAICGLFSTNDVTVIVNGCTPTTKLVTTTSGSNTPGSLTHLIENACPGDMIMIAPGLSGQTLTLSNEIEIGTDITVSAAGVSNFTISGGNQVRIFNIQAGAIMGIEDINLSNGFSPSSGGAFINFGIVRLSDVRFVNNKSGSQDQAFTNNNEVRIVSGHIMIEE